MSDIIAAHRGEFVESIIRKSGISIDLLGRKMDIARSTIYRHFTLENLDWGWITKYGKALNYDFSKHYPELQAYTSNVIMEDLVAYGDRDELLAKARVEIDKWKTIAYEKSEEVSKWKQMYYDLLTDTQRGS